MNEPTAIQTPATLDESWITCPACKGTGVDKSWTSMGLDKVSVTIQNAGDRIFHSNFLCCNCEGLGMVEVEEPEVEQPFDAKNMIQINKMDLIYYLILTTAAGFIIGYGLSYNYSLHNILP